MATLRPRDGRGGLRPVIPFMGIRPINVLQLEEILDRVYFESVVVDDGRVITFLSQPYADFLGIDRKEAIGRHVSEVIENSRMHIVVETGEVEIGKQRIRGQDLIVQRVPTRDGSGRTGRFKLEPGADFALISQPGDAGRCRA